MAARPQNPRLGRALCLDLANWGQEQKAITIMRDLLAATLEATDSYSAILRCAFEMTNDHDPATRPSSEERAWAMARTEFALRDKLAHHLAARVLSGETKLPRSLAELRRALETLPAVEAGRTRVARESARCVSAFAQLLETVCARLLGPRKIPMGGFFMPGQQRGRGQWARLVAEAARTVGRDRRDLHFAALAIAMMELLNRADPMGRHREARALSESANHLSKTFRAKLSALLELEATDCDSLSHATVLLRDAERARTRLPSPRPSRDPGGEASHALRALRAAPGEFIQVPGGRSSIARLRAAGHVIESARGLRIAGRSIPADAKGYRLVDLPRKDGHDVATT